MTLAEADTGMRRLNGSPTGAEETLNVQAALPLNLVMSGGGRMWLQHGESERQQGEVGSFGESRRVGL